MVDYSAADRTGFDDKDEAVFCQGRKMLHTLRIYYKGKNCIGGDEGKCCTPLSRSLGLSYHYQVAITSIGTEGLLPNMPRALYLSLSSTGYR